MEILKKIIAWFVGITFILTFFVYVSEIPIAAIMILIAGIILLPLVNDKIKGKLESEEKKKKYKTIRTIIFIALIIGFVSGLPTSDLENEVSDDNYDLSNITYTPNAINKEKVDESVSLTITETNGTYTGERIDGKKHGNGKYEWNDGTIYEGEFSEDKINGKGKLVIPNKGTYEGTFVNGKRNGQGVFTFANGDTYDGNWKDDSMNGQGTYTFSNGDIYVGAFLNNKFNGQGTYTKGSNKYTGTWKNNKYQK